MVWANLLAGPIADAVSRTLFHFLWEGAVIAAALAVAIYVFRPSSASIRYGLACVAMLAMVLAVSVTLAWNWPHSASVTIQSNGPHLRMPPVPFARPPMMPSSAPARVNWMVPAWLAGAGLLSLRSLIAWIAAMRLRRSGAIAATEVWRKKLARLGERVRVSRPVALLESCLTDVPVVIGFLRPAILVPAALFTGFPPEQLEMILLHELAHIRRCDYLVNLLQSIVEDVLFYHPAVWWVSSVMRAERENCCDDVVVAETSNARGFAAALAALEQNRWAAQEAALAVNGGNLMNRVRRLLEGRDRPRLAAIPVFFASLLPVAFVIAALGIGTAASHAQSVGKAPLVLPPTPAPRPPVLLAQAGPTPAPAPQPVQAVAEVESPYTQWLNEEAVYIISDEERAAYRRLTTDEEREKFIEQFWLRRDLTPDTEKNEVREEHYRRIAYANENFSAKDTPGWKTDRGMIYIKYGRPDERDEHRSGGSYERPIEEGGGKTVVFPFEKWRYRYIEGMGNDVSIEFVDTTMTGEFHMTSDPSEKDSLLYVPGAGLTLYEQNGLASKDDRFKRTDGTHLGTGTMPLPASMDQFKRLEQFAQLQAPKPDVPTVIPPEGALIEDIVFRGVRRTPQDLVRSTIRMRKGDKLDKAALDRDMLALWNTNRFTDIRVTYDQGQTGWIVNYNLVETVVERQK